MENISPNIECKRASTTRYIAELTERINSALEAAAAQVIESQDRMERNYNKSANPRSLNPGDKVLVLLPTSNSKYFSTWSGPHVVIRKCDNNN